MWITRWPLPALLSWLAAWFVYAAAMGAGLGPGPALAVGAAVAAALGWLHGERWRRLSVAFGFPVSVLALGWRKNDASPALANFVAVVRKLAAPR